jgi:hypothetical protein
MAMFKSYVKLPTPNSPKVRRTPIMLWYYNNNPQKPTGFTPPVVTGDSVKNPTI